MNRPQEKDYASHVAYTRALEAYCDYLAQPEQSEPQPLEDLTGVKVCCGEYATCYRPCTPRGRWLAERETPQPEQSEPVAKVVQKVIKGRKGAPDIYKYDFVLIDPALGPCDLYTAPPLLELSKLEIDTIAQQVGITAYEAPEWLQDFAKAILAAARKAP